MTDSEILARAISAGWVCLPALLYDEEGVDGFAWLGPDGRECFSLEVDGAPEVPDLLRELFDPNHDKTADNSAEAFASFLNGLLFTDKQEE